jgi:pyruvate formate lyase activating enzyme
MLNIQGLQKTTLLDYPGLVAATIFMGGCNMRCRFCHNMNIVTDPGPGEFSDEDVLRFLSSRSGILDGVCITGGEPTLYPELPDFIRLIKNLGYKVKLDTNGTNPQMLKALIDEGLIDYVAMDIKSSLSEYGNVCGIQDIKLAPIKESIDLLLSDAVDYEFRTTTVEEFYDLNTATEIGKLISGAKRYYLQGFVASEYVPDKTLHEVAKEKLEEYCRELEKYVETVEIRGV